MSTPAAPAATTVTAAVDGSGVRYGDQVTFAVSVNAPDTSTADLTGHVVVRSGSAVIAEGDTDASGHASLGELNRADPGTARYSVSFSGSASLAPSTGEFSVKTTQTNADISVGWPEKPQPGSDVAITADVIGTPDRPTGTATITYDGTTVADGPVDGNGKISGTATALTVGDHTVKVSYGGDVRFQPTTVSSTLTVKEPVSNPNQAGAAAAQAANPCPAAASACVDLSNEQAWLQSGGKITYGPVSITSGAAGSRTEDGMFSVFWRDKNHKSSVFNDAPMPNSVFFDGGIAFHQGSLSRQSNGCVHLSWDASETFYDALSVGDNVYVWGSAPY